MVLRPGGHGDLQVWSYVLFLQAQEHMSVPVVEGPCDLGQHCRAVIAVNVVIVCSVLVVVLF